MKRSAAHLKNIAALIMLLALVSLLLPFCNVTTPIQSTSVSGMEVIKIGAGVAKEYYSKGNIDNNYVLKDNLTWGGLKGGANFVAQHEEFYKLEIGIAICFLPILLCLLAMILTFLARGKASMLLPTLLIGIAFIENVVIIVGFSKLQDMIFSYTNSSGISITLLKGVYIFTLLCGIAFGIIMFLWITGGFRRPRLRDRGRKSNYYDKDDDDDDDSDDKDRKKRSGRSSGRGKKDRKDKKNRKGKKDKKDSKKRRKSRGKKNKKDCNNTKSDDTKKDQAQQQMQEQQQVPPMAYTPASGQLSGLTGMYQGAQIDLANNGSGMFTIGTTNEAMNRILNNSIQNLSELDGCSCMVQYDKIKKQYTIMSHSMTDLVLQTAEQNSAPVHLSNGDIKTVGAGTLLTIGNEANTIRLD